MICFVAAMEKEASYIIEASDILEEERSAFGRLLTCAIKGNDFYLLICGIGKVLAASSLTETLVRHKNITHVINIGVGGSLKPEEVGVFDVVISKACVQHDLDTSPIGDPIAFVSGINKVYFDSDPELIDEMIKICGVLGINSYVSNISSGDRFLTDINDKNRLVDNFDSASCDMESASLATVSDIYGIPFVALRVISDANGGSDEYSKNLKECCLMLAKIVKRFIFD